MAEPRAVVLGGGVGGLTCALALSRRFEVVLVAPKGEPTASSVAAGMLAPAMESALDAAAPPFPMMMAGLAAVERLAHALGAERALHRCGSLWIGDDAEHVAQGLHDLGAVGEMVSVRRAETLQPALSLSAPTPAVFAPQDARVDVAAMLAALQASLARNGVRRVAGSAVGISERSVTLASGETLAAGVVVAALGSGSSALVRDLPELAALTPIKGQLIRYDSAPAAFGGTMLRSADGYLALGAEGGVAGATMEAGLADTVVDPVVCGRFAAAAARLCPSLTGRRWRGAAGVRVAALDGVPLVGWSSAGPLIASGFRRNGWLLAPLAAEMAAALAEDRDPGAWAGAMAPGRFG